ncbi:MAG: response regulator [Bacteroidetes bacterium]|nr:MAG: response regulator [Bacteroidota bacterium]
MNRIRILAVDDDSDSLTVFREMVRRLLPEAEVFTTLSGRKGIGLTVREDPDVIFLDLVMPEMDGFEVCSELKKDETLRTIPVVFYTANIINPQLRIKALEAGADAFLSKPFRRK